METIMNKHRSTMSSTLVKHDIQDFYSSRGHQHSLDGVESSYGSGIFSKLQYDDLKTAHEESIIPVATNAPSIRTYNSALEERRVVEKPIEKKTADTMLKQQMLHDDKLANERAYRLAKECKKTKKNKQYGGAN